MEIVKFRRVRTPKPLKRLTKKFGVHDYVGNYSPHAKTQNDHPIGGVAAYAWNITLVWFLARDVIYTSRAYLMMPVSVCLSVCDVCALWSQVEWIPDIFACLDRWMSLLLTDNASSRSSDGMMPGFLVEEGGMEKLVIAAISLILLIFYRWTTWRICWNFFSNFCRKCILSEDGMTNYHIGLKQRHIVRILPTYKTCNRICVIDVRNYGIKCVMEKCILRNCVTAGN